MKKRKTIKATNKTFRKITKVMKVARALRTGPLKNDDQYIWMPMQVVAFFEIIVYEN
jgi:hypothetical protein